MSRFARGLTLTPKERAQTGIAIDPNTPAGTPGGILHSHTCSVELPNRSACTVSYRRINPRSHFFDFGAPLHQRLWIEERIEGGAEAIMEQARQLVPQAFRQAQQQEQKEMRRKTPPSNHSRTKMTARIEMTGPQAERLAGQYAACVALPEGRLVRVGPPSELPESVQREIADGAYGGIRLQGRQRLVVGICCRFERRWSEARLLAPLHLEGAIDPDPTPPEESLPSDEDLDEEFLPDDSD